MVQQVLEATAEMLGLSGYAGLRVEDVASRSGVNKTTIYRRWPTRQELAAAALAFVAEEPPLPDTGTLRGDLLVEAERTLAAASSPVGRGFLRMIQTERAEAEVEALARGLRERVVARRAQLIARGVERGELPAGTDPRIVLELVFAPIFVRLACLREPVDARYLERVIDLVLAGARAR
ncbi:MAG: TetR/AcrR family transcriptional regulator [Polyangiaceae bacterium]|nr:TetR/AcrR family transcriptional regulator [Polyangiaceae bacterium]